MPVQDDCLKHLLFLKEKVFIYGQCSEICGVNHGFMPIVVKGIIDCDTQFVNKSQILSKNGNSFNSTKNFNSLNLFRVKNR
jgi:heme/copper-type cytochrome/quinol oxidase subunit 2